MSPELISQRLRRLIIYCFYFTFLTTPLLWFQENSELFEFPKMIFIYSIASLILSIWISRMVVERRLIYRRSWFDYALLAFLASQIISTIFSIHVPTSLLGYYTRFHGGLFSTLAYLSLYGAYVSNVGRNEALKTIGFLISSSFISSLIAFPEHFGYALSCFAIDTNSQGLIQRLAADCWVQDIVTRIFGTFGQPNWLAAYIVTTMPLIWAQTQRVKSAPSRTFLFIANALVFATLLFTRSRSGLAAAAAGFGVYSLLSLLIYFRRTSETTKWSAWLSSFAGVALALALPLVIFGSEITPSVFEIKSRLDQTPQQSAQPSTNPDTSIPLIERGGTESGEIRKIVWQGAWDIFRHNLLIGTGVETFAYSYYNYRPVEHNLVSEWDFLYNKAHNEFLNLMANNGLIGIVSYLSIIFVLIALSLRQVLFREIDDTSLVNAGLLAGFIALAVSNFYGFSTVSVGVLFFIYLAISVILTSDLKTPTLPARKVKPRSDGTSLKLGQYLGVGLVGVLTVIIWYQIAVYFYADLVFAKATQAESSNDLTAALVDYNRALALAPYQARIYNSYADALSKAAYYYGLEEELETMTRLAQLAFSNSAQTFMRNPVHLNFYKTQAGVYLRLAPYDQSLLQHADLILSTGLKLAPTDAKLMYNLGLIKIDQEATSAAQAYFEQAVTAKANYEAARMQLAQLYEANGEVDKAIEQYQYILNYIAPGNSKAQQALEALEQ